MVMASKTIQSETNEVTLAAERIEQIAQLESEIEERRAEIDRLRIDVATGRASDDFEDNRDDELNDPSITLSDSASREEPLGDIIVLWEQPVADDRSVMTTVPQPDEHVPADDKHRNFAEFDVLPDMLYATKSSFGSDETSVASSDDASSTLPSPRQASGLVSHLLSPFGSPGTKAEPLPKLGASYKSAEIATPITEATSNPPSPSQTGGLVENLLRPFGSPGTKAEPATTSGESYKSAGTSVPSTEAISTPPSPGQTGGLIEHLLLPLLSPGSKTEPVEECQALKRMVEERDLKIKSLEKAISSDTKIIGGMKDTIERLSVELLSAKKMKRAMKALGSHSSYLEDEIEELRVENTKLRISSQMLQEEKRRIEEEMNMELQLLHIETGRHEIF